MRYSWTITTRYGLYVTYHPFLSLNRVRTQRLSCARSATETKKLFVDGTCGSSNKTEPAQHTNDTVAAKRGARRSHAHFVITDTNPSESETGA